MYFTTRRSSKNIIYNFRAVFVKSFLLEPSIKISSISQRSGKVARFVLSRTGCQPVQISREICVKPRIGHKLRGELGDCISSLCSRMGLPCLPEQAGSLSYFFPSGHNWRYGNNDSRTKILCLAPRPRLFRFRLVSIRRSAGFGVGFALLNLTLFDRRSSGNWTALPIAYAIIPNIDNLARKRLYPTWFELMVGQLLNRCRSDPMGRPYKRLKTSYESYVPIVHSDRYFLCSSVNSSILTPIAASFRLATCSSILLGTGCTFLSSLAP